MGAPYTRLTKTARQERDREIVKLRKDGLRTKEIANRVNLTKQGVDTAIRTRLRNLINPPPEEEVIIETEEEMGTCPQCSSELKRIRWNRECDIVACDNPGCMFYRTPQRVTAKDKPWREKAYGQKV